MLKLALAGVVAVIIILALIIIIRNKPDLWFWIFLNLFFDPGGYAYGLLGGTLVGPLHITDVFVSGMLICLLSAKINWNAIFKDKIMVKFLFYLFIFFAYYLIVYGGAVPYLQNDFNYSTFLIKNRVFVYGFFITIAVYAFSLRSLFYFYTSTLFIGVICLTLYFISLLTGIELIPVEEIARNPGEEMMRISMVGYGIFYLLFPLALTTYLLGRRIQVNLIYKNWLYYSGMVMIITLLITLTRRTQIDIIGTAIIISVILSYLFRTGKLSGVLKLIPPTILVFMVLSFTLPNYVGYISDIGIDTFLLITTGRDSKGESDQRVSGTGDYELVKEYIGNNLFFGTGYTQLYWTGPGTRSTTRGDEFARAADAAGEVPIYYLLFGFGIAGAILMIPLYFMMGKLFFNLINLLRLTLMNYLADPIVLIFSIYIMLTIVQKFTINFYTLSLDFRSPNMSFTAVLMGIGFALYRKLQLNLYTELESPTIEQNIIREI